MKSSLDLVNRKSLDLQISSVVGYFKNISAFPVNAIYFGQIVLNKINGVYMKVFGNWKMT